MKPFNLKAALLGEPVVDNLGREVVIAGYNPHAQQHQRVTGWVRRKGIDGTAMDFVFRSNESGRTIAGNQLGMAGVKHEVWINVYPAVAGQPVTVYAYPSEEAANRAAGLGRVACVKTKWEE